MWILSASGPGDLHEGIGPREAAIFLVIPNVSSCSTVVLELQGPDMSRGQAFMEVALIAMSLRLSPEPTEPT